jgi:hypothetical protein
MSPEEANAKIDKAVEIIMPEAKQIYEQATNGMQTTRDGYGVVLSYLTQLNDKLVSQVILIALGRLGYPLETIASIKKIMWG